ncbi:MCE family protein [Candidatus Dependentiae bacterium]|nr:MCE family protein [Candidatus Dependentiae bacterium]
MLKKSKTSFKILYLFIFISLFQCCSDKKNNTANIDKTENSDNYYSINIIFDDVNGLEENSEVMIDSLLCGYVESFDFVKDKVKVGVKIKKGNTVFEDADIIIDDKKHNQSEKNLFQEKIIVIKNIDKNSIPAQNNSVLIGKTPVDTRQLKPKFLL